MALNTKQVILIDGLGACTSALFLGVVLPAMQVWIGMPIGVLYLLAAVAVLYAFNAFTAYRFAGDGAGAERRLRAIVVANLLYCLLTGSLVAVYLRELTAWGVAYFTLEVAVILGLVSVERNTLRRAAASDSR